MNDPSRTGLVPTIRAIAYWVLTSLYFYPAATFLAFLASVVPAKHMDGILYLFTSTLVRCAGMRLVIDRSPRVEKGVPYYVVSNHVNVFDAFVVYSSIKGHVRGFELASHFRIPVYGWFMKHFGNVPVPDERTATGLREMLKGARRANASGMGLIAFPEGTRTRTGRVGPFEPGIFRIAIALGVPIVPVTLLDSYRHHAVGNWRLYPGDVRVILHDPIVTKGRNPNEARDLADEVRAIVCAPLERES